MTHRSGTKPKAAVDRTITLGLVATLVLETAGALHWAGATENRVAALEAQSLHDRPINMRLTRLEEQVLGIRRALERIEADISDVEESIND